MTMDSSRFDELKGLVCKFRMSWLDFNLVGRVTDVDGDYIRFSHKNGTITFVRKDELLYIAPLFNQPPRVVS